MRGKKRMDGIVATAAAATLSVATAILMRRIMSSVKSSVTTVITASTYVSTCTPFW